MSHINSGKCDSCLALINKYPGFNEELKTWFIALQIENPEAHISCAGRNEDDQNALLLRGATKAKWGQSAHNFNAALDIFELRKGVYTLDIEWFKVTVCRALYSKLNWYGRKDAPYFELPHVELMTWNDMAHQGLLKLVSSAAS